MFKTDHRRHQVLQLRQISLGVLTLVDQQVLQRGHVPGNQSRHLRNQRRHVGGSRPLRIAIVEHDRQHRRQFSVRQDIFGADQILIQQAHVGHHPDRHERIDRALKFDQDVQVHPLAFDPYPPDHIVGAVAQVIGHVAAGDLLQGAVVQAVQPVIRDEAHDQVAHQFGRGEQQFVGGIVIVGHEQLSE